MVVDFFFFFFNQIAFFLVPQVSICSAGDTVVELFLAFTFRKRLHLLRPNTPMHRVDLAFAPSCAVIRKDQSHPSAADAIILQ